MTQTVDAPQDAVRTPKAQQLRKQLFRKQTLGWLLLGLFATFLLAASYTGPREEPAPPSLEYVGGYVLTDKPPEPLHRSGWATDTRVSDLRPSSTGSVLVWTDARDDYSVSWTWLEPGDPQLATLRAQPASLAVDDPRDVLELAARIGGALGVIALLAVALGPRPRHGSRWFWFWLLFAPLGVGAAWFAWTELVRTPDERKPLRRSGFDGFFTMVGLTIAITAGLWFAQGL